ncbi:MAG: hypothetical protein OEQ53_08105 [Saprospiraceae bacterium]|nr:hypothetical protein [Saprospiraceae bacterium]
MTWRITLVVCAIVVNSPAAYSQGNNIGELLNIYLDCSYCDQTLIRSKIDYVNYVRDPKVADIHILVTRVRSGSNGFKHTLNFLGREAFVGTEHELVLDEAPNTANRERQEQIGRVIATGLLPYWLQTDLRKEMDVVIKRKATDQPISQVSFEDPWNQWVFSMEAGGSIDAESNTNEYVGWARVGADRVTELWRVRILFYTRFDSRKFESEAEVITSSRERSYASSSVVRSLNDHLSLGMFASLFRSTYSNFNLSSRFGPAIEYSLYPYSEVHERELTIGYRISHLYRDYSEETIYLKLSEHLYNHSIVVSARFKQPWGSLYAQLEGSQFLHDPAQNRVEFDARLSLRISKGLSITVGNEVEFINDQRSLPAREISLEELLLGQRQSATSFRINGQLGLRYTFGSIYNNVVNTRL